MEAWFSWLRQIKTKVVASQSLHWTLLLTAGVVSKEPPPYPTNFDPRAWSTHPLLGLSLGYPPVPTKTASPLHFRHRTGLEPGCARRQAKTQWPHFIEIGQILSTKWLLQDTGWSGGTKLLPGQVPLSPPDQTAERTLIISDWMYENMAWVSV